MLVQSMVECEYQIWTKSGEFIASMQHERHTQSVVVYKEEDEGLATLCHGKH